MTSTSTTTAVTVTAGPPTRWPAVSLMLGQVVFTLAWLLLGLVSPGFTIFDVRIAPYSAISAPLSGLGLGPTGPYMNAAFVLSGLLGLVGVGGIFGRLPGLTAHERWLGLGLFALSPVGMILDGVFTIEHFGPHLFGYLLAGGAPVIAFVAAGRLLRQRPGWQRLARGLLAAGPVTLLLLVISLATFDQAAVMAGQGVAGLTERMLCLWLAAWLVALGWKAFQPSAG